jgi:ABC-type transport system involved in Fe-S cluster assembly fused permease/ATPase subunit
MFFTFAAMQDVFLMDHSLNNSSLGFYEHIWEEVLNTSTTFSSTFYIIADVFPKVFTRIFFEVVHTLGVCSMQFGAFFAIVFWFFLFLYTFFVMVKLEMYFEDKRELQKKNQNTYLKSRKV